MARKKKVKATFDPIVEDISIDLTEPSESEGLEVKDLDSLEIISQDDSLERIWIVEGGEKYECLRFPRALLIAKFAPLGGSLSLPKIQASEWFRKTLADYGITNKDRIVKNSLGNILLQVRDSNDFEVRQKA